MENKWEINHLIENLKRNKDAVVIIGDKAVQDINVFPINEESKEVLNRKTMVKDPEKFWSYYKDNIYNQTYKMSKTERAVRHFIENTDVIKNVVDLNYTGHLSTFTDKDEVNIIQLKGDLDVLRCMSCGTEYEVTKDMVNTKSVLKCECKGKIAPTITMFGEKYLEKNTKAVKDAIFLEEDGEIKLLTHCLIFVGVDFEESYINELIDSYDAIKNQISTDEETYFTVIITDDDSMSINYYRPEFATDENMPEAIERLIAMIKED